jgi:hypothetical protein
LHSEEFHILYSSPNIIRQIKSRIMRWAGHVARMGEECVQGFDGKARRKYHLEDQGVDGIRMDLREIGWGSVDWIQWLRIVTLAGSCEYGDEPSGSGAT